MKSLSYLNKYFIKYKWRLLAGVVFVIASNYFAVKMPIFLGQITDGIINGTTKNYNLLGIAFNIDMSNLLDASLKIGAIFISLSILSGIFLFFMRQTIIKVSRFIEYDLKNEIYAHYQKLDYSFYKMNNTGDLMNRISEDVSYVRNYLGPGIMYTLNLIVLFAMVVFQMIMIDGFLTFLVLIPLPIMSFLIYKVSSKMNALSTEVQKEQSKLSTSVQETFSGIRIIKAYSREAELNMQFEETSNLYRKKSMRLVLVNSLFMPTITFLIGLSTVITIYVGGLLSYPLPGKEVGIITLGAITAFIFFVNKLTWPFASIGWVTSLTQRAAASQTRINEFLQTAPIIVSKTNEPFHFQGAIEFRNVSYVYPNSGIEAIKNLSFIIKPNETLAFIGRTGAGKSTILKLILRQIDPTSGDIFIDGNNLKDINLEDFRDQSGIVPQEVFLFSDTIENNLRFGALNETATDEDLIRVTKAAHVLHNIEEFEDKFETLLGERGVNLSGGQKQRISIARALIRNPKLLLFDDCLSAVDTETEEIILSNLKADLDRKTSVIVSHRISSLRNSDKIIVIDNGEKREEGSHDQLMKIEGIYAEMYQQQLTEENAE